MISFTLSSQPREPIHIGQARLRLLCIALSDFPSSASVVSYRARSWMAAQGQLETVAEQLAADRFEPEVADRATAATRRKQPIPVGRNRIEAVFSDPPAVVPSLPEAVIPNGTYPENIGRNY